jgi:excinuclease ABC subunit B
MQKAIDETNRRRKIQHQYNLDHGVTPQTIRKSISGGVIEALRGKNNNVIKKRTKVLQTKMSGKEIDQEILKLTNDMNIASKNLRFEEAAQIRDEIKLLREARLMFF